MLSHKLLQPLFRSKWMRNPVRFILSASFCYWSYFVNIIINIYFSFCPSVTLILLSKSTVFPRKTFFWIVIVKKLQYSRQILLLDHHSNVCSFSNIIGAWVAPKLHYLVLLVEYTYKKNTLWKNPNHLILISRKYFWQKTLIIK